MSLPDIPSAARQAIVQGVYADHPVSNLERLGLSARILTLLGNSRFQIVTLEDLVAHTREDILSIHSIGEKSLESILDCLARYDKLPQFAHVDGAVALIDQASLAAADVVYA